MSVEILEFSGAAFRLAMPIGDLLVHADNAIANRRAVYSVRSA